MAMIDSKEAQRKIEAGFVLESLTQHATTWVFVSLQRNTEESTAGRPKEEVFSINRAIKRSSESPSSHISASSTSNGGRWKSKGKRHGTTDEDLDVPCTCEDVDPFTPRIRNLQSSRKTRMPNNVKTYDGTGDLEDHLKIFQAAAQVERWQKKYVKDPVEIRNIMQRDGETIEEFMERFKIETGRIRGVPECM
ncbi:hypothetical protein Tco_0727101 [Tanacetum coccineum]|uniref:Reverse transcriptase domain-containing protein n=1 Tax=Tanacetum coccineum TaxID=301880 RepID=A0ABQ4YI28_9ASTR